MPAASNASPAKISMRPTVNRRYMVYESSGGRARDIIGGECGQLKSTTLVVLKHS